MMRTRRIYGEAMKRRRTSGVEKRRRASSDNNDKEGVNGSKE